MLIRILIGQLLGCFLGRVRGPNVAQFVVGWVLYVVMELGVSRSIIHLRVLQRSFLIYDIDSVEDVHRKTRMVAGNRRLFSRIIHGCSAASLRRHLGQYGR